MDDKYFKVPESRTSKDKNTFNRLGIENKNFLIGILVRPTNLKRIKKINIVTPSTFILAKVLLPKEYSKLSLKE